MNLVNLLILSIVLSTSLAAKLPGYSAMIPDCPSDEPLSYTPHEVDCNKYYVCSYGTVTLMSCRKDLHWNPIGKYCDLPENAGCTSGQTTTTSTESTTTEPPTATPEPSTTTPEPPTTTPEPSTITPEPPTTTSEPPTTTPRPTCENSNAVFVPHETDCNKFYACPDGILFTCKNGFEFSYEEQTCVIISDYGCTASKPKKF